MKTIKYYTQEELEKLFKAVKKSNSKYWLRDYCIFRTTYRCGLRASEVGLLSLGDYNRQTGELYCKRLYGSERGALSFGLPIPPKRGLSTDSGAINEAIAITAITRPLAKIAEGFLFTCAGQDRSRTPRCSE